ncbi:neurotrimin-like isoform X2 [Macrosteles quadrilineatus]|uniref:neurotrimin-like isoform X2 n=1 Tax=Macrosteles quadrilineatus TaxID=74068 RepID=UPI0023E18474|nr:neurotrimin-like isoform X2 [Macrosteles quadrilineatus]
MFAEIQRATSGAVLCFLLLAGTLAATNVQGQIEDPEFVDQIENITVPAGRSVKLACTVKNLGSYKVAWMHFEQSAILTVHSHVITRNPRISVTHDKHRTWFLHISNVQEEDKGRYMCQINTVTAKTQFGYLHVVVPPNIDDSLSSSDVIVRENSNVTLTCHATGSPPPSIKWKRDDGSKININKTLIVSEWEGEILEISKISRLDMGAYLCIASNSVPPSVSKRIKVSVDFPPMLWIPHQLVGVPPGYNVTLECHTEAHPTSLNYWTRKDNHMIHDSRKYKAETSQGSPSYKTHMRLTIYNIQEQDYGAYKCVAKNPRGETDGSIRLYNPKGEIKDGDMNNSINPYPAKNDKGNKYQSSLNEIDKSEQKSQESPAKGTHYDWPENKQIGGAGRQEAHVALLVLSSLNILWLAELLRR